MKLDVNFPAYHGRISANEAEKRLLSDKSELSAGKYLVRSCGWRDYAISYLTTKLAIKHLKIPKQKNHKMYQFNPQLKTLQDKVDFLTKKITFVKFLDGLSYLNFNNQEDLKVVYDCNICDKDFNDQKLKSHYIHGHYQVHTIAFCTNCGDLVRQNNLGDHKQKCSEVKVKCELCDFVSHWRKCLKQHMILVHSAERETCQECGRTFPSQIRLDNHMQSKHYFSYVCKTCGKSFATRQGRNKHTRSKHMTFILSEALSDELTYKSLDSNVKFLHQKGESLKNSLSQTELETWKKCFGTRVITESERLARNEKIREKRKNIRDKAKEETICIVFD